MALAPIPHLPKKLNMCPLKTLDFQMYTYTFMYKYIQRRPDSKGILGVFLKCQAMVKKLLNCFALPAKPSTTKPWEESIILQGEPKGSSRTIKSR